MQGLLNIGDILARRFGLAELWDGAEGFRAVAQAKLQDVGVPIAPIQLTGEGAAVTPMQLAERANFIKRRKKVKA
jgi:hypothetical protein